ncbi:ATP-binding protein [Rheinheimera sp.]|uniref:ATP-binding protein n=1 Tax=Rheinheimera sp. TaxID=1869214 RepID=UPI00307ECD78
MNWQRFHPFNYLAGRIFLWFWLVLSVAVAGTMLLTENWLSQTELHRPPPHLAEPMRQISRQQPAFASEAELQRFLKRQFDGVWLLVRLSDTQVLNRGAIPPKLDPSWITELAQLQRPRLLTHRNYLLLGPALVRLGDEPVAAFQLRQKPERPWWHLAALPEELLVPFLLAVSAIASLILAFSITRPLRELSQSHLDFARGQLQSRVSHLAARQDELGAVGRGFNTMAQQIEALIENQQRLLRDVSHELRSPLTRSQLALALQQRQQDSPALQRIEQELQLLDQLLDELLTFSRLDTGQYPLDKQPLDLVELLQAILELNQLEADNKQQQLLLEAPQQALYSADQRLIGRAIENVVRNAIKYSPPDSTIRLQLQQAPQGWTLSICDQGPGVPADQLQQIFAPFFRVSQVREHHQGTGLGLAIAAQAMRQHQGAISASLTDQGGLCVRFEFR